MTLTTKAPAFQPAPIEAQIKAVENEIAIVNNVTAKAVAERKAAPAWRAIQLHALRSVLDTLHKVRDGKLAPAPETTSA